MSNINKIQHFQNITLNKITNVNKNLPFVSNTDIYISIVVTLHKDFLMKTATEEAAHCHKCFHNRLQISITH